MGSLPDNSRMEGNCRNAPVGIGKNEAYPCIDSESNDGYCVTGPVDPAGKALPMTLSVNRWDEPDVIKGERPVQLVGTVTTKTTVTTTPHTTTETSVTSATTTDLVEDSAGSCPFLAPLAVLAALVVAAAQ